MHPTARQIRLLNQLSSFLGLSEQDCLIAAALEGIVPEGAARHSALTRAEGEALLAWLWDAIGEGLSFAAAVH